jgi:hypothetical protein
MKPMSAFRHYNKHIEIAIGRHFSTRSRTKEDDPQWVYGLNYAFYQFSNLFLHLVHIPILSL